MRDWGIPAALYAMLRHSGVVIVGLPADRRRFVIGVIASRLRKRRYPPSTASAIATTVTRSRRALASIVAYRS